MKKLLRIDASARSENSHSRKAADQFQQRWLRSHDDGKIIERDLATSAIPHIQQETIVGFFSPADTHTAEIRKAVALSDTLIDEIFSADEILISTPLYNFSIPSSLKAYIDHIVRIGKTFTMNERGFSGLIKEKRLYIIAAKGAVYSQTPLASLDFLEPYLRSVFTCLGFESIEFLTIEGTTTDQHVANTSHQQALERMEVMMS